MTTVLIALLAACGRPSTAAGPQGWQPIPGTNAAWTTGTGATAQEYRYVTRPFTGGLQDLASAVTIDVLLHRHGAKLQGSVPFGPCPGQAGVATFTLPGGKTLEQAFALVGKRAVQTSYVRPANAPADPNVTPAMQQALCATPA